MPRLARVVAAGYPHHVVQRGNNREKVFDCNDDRKKYLSLIKKYSIKWDCKIMAYCLMSNHVHMLIRPQENITLSKMMQGISLCYTQYFNRLYKRTGRLWESRYHSSPVEDYGYLWAVARYIEQNPVRAGIVQSVSDYSYSSAIAHIHGNDDEILGEDLFDENQRTDYACLLESGMPERELKTIRYLTRTGKPL